VTSAQRDFRASNRLILAALLGALALAWAALRLGAAVPGGLSLCAAQRLCGLRCPLCGLTRGLDALARGDLAAARAHHPWTIAVAAALVIELVGRALAAAAPLSEALIPRLRRADALAHGAAALAYLAYAVFFLVRQAVGPL